jgi:hypothetical protein
MQTPLHLDHRLNYIVVLLKQVLPSHRLLKKNANFRPLCDFEKSNDSDVFGEEKNNKPNRELASGANAMRSKRIDGWNRAFDAREGIAREPRAAVANTTDVNVFDRAKTCGAARTLRPHGTVTYRGYPIAVLQR